MIQEKAGAGTYMDVCNENNPERGTPVGICFDGGNMVN
jgi:hypothetical protein